MSITAEQHLLDCGFNEAYAERMELLLILLVILVLARLAGAFTENIGQTAILGELLAGVVLEVVVTAFPNILPQFVDISEKEVFKAICNLGIFFLMFMAGMEMRLEQLAEASKRGSALPWPLP